MKQNIYDDPDFFAGYAALRAGSGTVNELLEQPAIHSLLPDLHGKAVLDLGCGAGRLCRHLVTLGAARVVGLDISSRMICQAREEHGAHEAISFEHSPIEDGEFGTEAYDLVVSSLALHYVQDLRPVFRKIEAALRPGGRFVFSMEHPLCTCTLGRDESGWHTDEDGRRLFWKVDEYSREGLRRSRWFVDGVVRYHRMLSTIVNDLVESGLSVERVLEPHSGDEKHEAALEEEKRRPPFLMVRAAKAA
ncbi:class I SAM-dependent methyltransferase [soil metagenome]